MALTWTTVIVGAFVVFGLPIITVVLNRWKRNSGWWLLAALVAFVIVGNVLEKLITGASPRF